MNRKTISRSSTSDTPAHAHRPAGRNPRNRPAAELDAAPPQPDAPEQSPVDDQQDQQPVHPEPLLREHPDWPEPQREMRSG